MKLVVKKSRLSGVAPMPGSKSHTIRALAIASLAEGTSIIRSPLASSDTLSAVSCYKAFGAEIDTSDPKAWKVVGTGGIVTAPDKTINIGNSGTTLNIAAGTASLASKGVIRLTGDDQVQSRPATPLLQSLKDLGAQAESMHGNGKAPISIAGRLQGGRTEIECFTSQHLTSLLLAAPLAENDTEIVVSILNEPDYVQMTLDWLDRQHIKYYNDGMRHFKILGKQKYKAFDISV
ncbi:MAG: 3-phosphoshikimate 1-carboxyvinyltransferase, partial [Lentisphaerae bacterium]|nr:3-phosphoshikimate 1-carboxyvinyltransferase [Lentisphaerota bacterium]